MIGRTISHYKILAKIGEGGMGVVYKAEDTKLDRQVAIKFLPQHLSLDENAKTRFVHEAKTASALNHPNISTIYEIDETDDGKTFIVMAYYRGETLKEKVEKGPLEIDEALDITAQIAAGLADAHEMGIVHRDIKPSNVLVAKGGRAEIIDFGLAKLAEQTKMTKTGRTMGTVAYMSPEQARGEDVDERSDVFSLGAVLYELLTGRRPFTGEHEAAVLYEVVHEEPKSLSIHRSDISGDIQNIVDKALMKDVSSRYQNVTELRDDLQCVRTGSAPVAGPVVPAARPHFHRYRKFIAPLTVLIVSIAVILLVPAGRHKVREWLGLGVTAAKMHIVVLPIENVGQDPDNQAFCDGLMEMLTSKLSQLEQFYGSMWVIPASEVRRSGITSPGEAWKAFGVNLVIAGSLQRQVETGEAGTKGLRLILNLIEVKSMPPRQLDSKIIGERLTDVSFLQNETIAQMAEMLDVQLAPRTQIVLAAGGTSVSLAYDYYLQGRGYLLNYEKIENIDYAIELFERAIEHDSLYSLAYAGLGEGYWRKYSFSRDTRWIESAVKNCGRAVELDDMLAPVHVTLGIIHRGTGEYDEAVAEFRRALELDPASAAAYRGMARAYADQGKPDEAEATYLKAIEMKPDYWGGYDRLGLFYYGQGQYEDAVVQFQKVTEFTPAKARSYNHLGAAYYALERWDEARQMFKRSIEIKPAYRTWSNLGVIDYIEGHYADAAANFEKALEINDKSYITWANLANACYWMPDGRDRAIELYRRASEMAEEQLRVNPRDAEVIVSLAGYCVMIGEEDRALTLTEKALELAPDDWWVMYDAGYTYEQLGDREKALEWIGKAIEKGYPKKEIERDPWLADLREDERFQKLMQESE